ncbi:unnamed protein product [Rotaria sp. Silwood2]|nr:unnamed protein product [Rotaria sp. Silwood2]CAF2498253.1 unnamed protein product [Rotaria sp. Silwood2]CAF2813572.1 unnamed protein product [Rotaria sp. Silwood2]CAF2895902.1 unnamed protein product [Rotaria sp. Silwood2]CAF3946740.1 unnamed protein product [Rotaria sp. Silwood2]
MRSLILLLLLVGTAHGLLGTISNLFNNVGNTIQSVTNQISQTATNLWNSATNQVNNVVGNVVDSAGNVYGQLVNTANGVQFAANFLWDNVFGPAYDMLVEGGQLFLDDKFGNIVSSIGRRSILPENSLSTKYAELTARFKSTLHDLYEGLFQMEKEALDALQKGEKNIEDKIRAFYDRLDEIHKKINQLAVEMKQELESYALTIQGDTWVHILNQYTQNIETSVKTMGRMFQQLAESLMKNLINAALTIIPDALAAIQNLKQQGLLTFLNH